MLDFVLGSPVSAIANYVGHQIAKLSTYTGLVAFATVLEYIVQKTRNRLVLVAVMAQDKVATPST